MRLSLRRSSTAPPEHERRAGAFLDAIEQEFERDGPRVQRLGRFVGFEFDGTTRLDPWDTISKHESGKVLLAQPPETLVSAVVVAAARARPHEGFTALPYTRVLSALVRKALPFTRDDAKLLLGYVGNAKGSTRVELMKTALHAVELVGVDGLEDELHAARKRFERVAALLPSSDANRVRARAAALLPDDTPFRLIADDDWAERMRPQLARFRDASALLGHLESARAKSKPTKTWERRAAELVEGREELVHLMLETAAEANQRRGRVWHFDGQDYQEYTYLAAPNAALVKGAAWAAVVLDPDWAAPLLARIVRKAFEVNDAVANACILALGRLSDESAVRELGALQASIKHRGYQKRIVAALETVGERTGLSPNQLLERLVPDLGLEADGTKELPVGRWHAVVTAEPTGAKLTWRDGEKAQKSVPTEVKERHANELKSVKADVAELRKQLSVERARIESLFAEEPRWSRGDWSRYYLDHPLVGVFARTLIWSFDGVPALGRDAPAERGEVELWHPIRAEPDEVTSWRERLVADEIRQPLKQAYREVYLLAPAEEQTRLYSNRFAGHVLRYPQAYALFKGRGWSGNALGPWDGGYEATIKREFRAHGLRAEWYLEHVETDGGSLIADLATTDQVRFYPLAGRDPNPVPLAEVPPLAFSEAMRDIDLFVSVASIAADPTWLDRGLERYNDYWVAHAFGELTASARGRREALAELLPKLRIAERCELDERHLVVRGDLGTYKIHLGSGNVLMEPDRYVCIVAAPGSRQKLRGKVFLPFEDDSRFAVILSKAFLLAEDAKITDPNITRQLNHRR